MVVMHAPASYSCSDALKACLESRWALTSLLPMLYEAVSLPCRVPCMFNDITAGLVMKRCWCIGQRGSMYSKEAG